MDPMVEEQEIVIVGAGIAGLATALALTRLGISSRVLERSAELRAKGAALSLYPNAWFALKALGVDHKLTSVYETWKKLIFTNLDTGTSQEFNFANSRYRKEATIRTVHRKALLRALAEDLPPNTIRFSSKLVSIESETSEDSSTATTATLLHLEDGTVIRAKVVIGCDGVHSPVAQWLGLPKPTYAGQTAVRGVSVFPEGHGLEMDMRHYVNGSIRAAFVPLSSTDIYWFVSERTSNYSEMNLPTSPDMILEEVITNLVKDFPSEFINVAKNTDLSTLTWHPVIFRAPWSVAVARANTTSVTIAGDAMHPMTPDVGQGGCSALEDAVILARCLSQARSVKQWPEAALQKYVGQRRWRAAWIVSCAWYVSWVQHAGGTGKEWWSGAARWFRDRVFYNIIPLIALSLRFDCGELTAAK